MVVPSPADSEGARDVRPADDPPSDDAVVVRIVLFLDPPPNLDNIE